MSERRTPLSVVIGPTAAGKSRVAMAIAEARGLDIVSADSRQLYRGFDIGTAKPSPADLARVRHHGVDVIDPGERYSAHRWAADAERWIAAARADGRGAMVVGGTGFYVRALVQPLAPVPELDAERRRGLERWLAEQDGETIARWCRRLDPARAELGRVQQLRAIETALLAGTRLSEAHAAAATAPVPRRAVRYLVIDPGAVLAARIEERVHAMVDAGWIDEVARLRTSVSADAPAWKASGYETLRRHVAGELSRGEAVERVVVETRQYAKRQRTWCRHQLTDGPVMRLDPDAPDAVQRAIAWWDGRLEEET